MTFDILQNRIHRHYCPTPKSIYNGVIHKAVEWYLPNKSPTKTFPAITSPKVTACAKKVSSKITIPAIKFLDIKVIDKIP